MFTNDENDCFWGYVFESWNAATSNWVVRWHYRNWQLSGSFEIWCISIELKFLRSKIQLDNFYDFVWFHQVEISLFISNGFRLFKLAIHFLLDPTEWFSDYTKHKMKEKCLHFFWIFFLFLFHFHQLFVCVFFIQLNQSWLSNTSYIKLRCVIWKLYHPKILTSGDRCTRRELKQDFFLC